MGRGGVVVVMCIIENKQKKIASPYKEVARISIFALFSQCLTYPVPRP